MKKSLRRLVNKFVLRGTARGWGNFRGGKQEGGGERKMSESGKSALKILCVMRTPGTMRKNAEGEEEILKESQGIGGKKGQVCQTRTLTIARLAPNTPFGRRLGW